MLGFDVFLVFERKTIGIPFVYATAVIVEQDSGHPAEAVFVRICCFKVNLQNKVTRCPSLAQSSYIKVT